MQGYHQEPQYAPGRHAAAGPQLHEGVRRFMNGVYAWMSLGIGVTAAVAWGISQSQEAMAVLFGTPLRWVLFLGPLAMAWMLPPRIPNMTRGMAVGAFMIFASLLGAALSYIPIVYSASSIGGVMLGTVGMFATMAVIGFITKKDLTGMGQFFLMALIGAIIASLINGFFIQSGAMAMGISALVAVVAAGLTAYHTQAVKQLYMMHGGAGNLAVLGALLLYVDFLNLFLSLLRLFGGGRN